MAEKTIEQLTAAFNIQLREMDAAMHDLWVADRQSWNDLVNASMKNEPVTRELSRSMIGGKIVSGEGILGANGLVKDKFRDVITAVYVDDNAAWNVSTAESHQTRYEVGEPK